MITGKMFTAASVLASGLLMGGSASAQQQVRVSGTTTADATLVKNTLQTILQFSHAKTGCVDVGLVVPQTLPGYVPSAESYRTEQTGVIYERWRVDLCGKTETFLVAFWPADVGGTLFKVSYPPPSDLP